MTRIMGIAYRGLLSVQQKKLEFRAFQALGRIPLCLFGVTTAEGNLVCVELRDKRL